jgi:hypothetical protein
MPRHHGKINALYRGGNRRQGAVHEAGHIVMWRAFGIECDGYIWPREQSFCRWRIGAAAPWYSEILNIQIRCGIVR